VSALRTKYPNLLFWTHVDVAERHWSIPALVSDFGMRDHILITHWMTDASLSHFYSACDLTILPSLGEGFGFPIVESLACGVPVIHGDYGGGAELIPHKKWLVDPAILRMDTPHNCVRPVYQPEDWVLTMEWLLSEPTKSPEECRSTVEHLFWPSLWPVWEKWFREGIQ
jgi:glycosyltransferase involved in cell wall biosynthesis